MTTKTIKGKEETSKKTMKDVMSLWLHTSNNEVEYLTGNLSNDLDGLKVTGFYNKEKKNEKEPDIRVYLLNEDGKTDHVIVSLWNQTSKDNKNYLSGMTDEKEKVVAFINEDNKETNKPYIRVYFKN